MGLAGNGRCCCCSVSRLSYGIAAGGIRARNLRPSRPGWRSTEVTVIFTTARPMLSRRPLMGTLGNGRHRLSGMAPKPPSTTDCSAERLSRRRNSRPLFHRAKYSISSPPASVGPRWPRQTELQKFYRGAVDAPHVANHQGSLCHRCPAHRLVPSGRPRALGHAHRLREPRDPGLSFRPLPGRSMEPRGRQQKTLRSGRLGRVREKRTVDLAVRQDRSHEPGMRRRIARSYSACGQFFRSGAASLGSWCRERKCS